MARNRAAGTPPTAKAIISVLAAILVVVAGAEFAIKQGFTRQSINCSAGATRLYVANEGSGSWFEPDRDISVYCGSDTTPNARILKGLEPVVQRLDHDHAGNVYVAEWDHEDSNGALLVYDERGTLVKALPGLGRVMQVVIDRKTGTAYVSVGHTPVSTSYRGRVSNGKILAIDRRRGVIDRWEVPVGGVWPEGGADPSELALDGLGRLYARVFGDSLIHVFDRRTGRVIATVRAPGEAITVGPDDRLYTARANGSVAVYEPRHFRLVRVLKAWQPPSGDFSAIAVASDGTVYVAERKHGALAVFPPRSDRAQAIVRGLDEPNALAIDERGNVYVLCLGHQGQTNAGKATVDVLQARSMKLIRTYEKGIHQPVIMDLVP